MIGPNLLVALSSLKRNRLRTSLTILGIGIGIATVICTAALGGAGTARVEAQIAAVGEDFLWVRPGSRNLAGARTGSGGARTLTVEDAAALATLPEIAACSPVIQGREQLILGNRNWNTRYQGVLPAFFEIRRRTLAVGSPFTAYGVDSNARVMVLGMTVSRRLFGDENPVGRTVRINRFPFRIIGVLDTRGATRGGVDRDDVVFVPLPTAHRNLDRRDSVSDIMCGVRSPELMDRAEAQAASLLRVRHRLAADVADDFEIQKPLESLAMRAQTSRTMTLMMTAVGAVSLVVGGVGIMNIMLVSVGERKREIGVRLAIGARVRDVRWQFLLEAAAIGLVGGAVGVASGLVGAWLFASGFGWAVVVSPDIVAFATLAAGGAGLLFGCYPAHRASLLETIDAVRLDD